MWPDHIIGVNKMIKNGTYKTEHGSTLTVYGENGNCRDVKFDWFEEGACIDCVLDAYNIEDYYLRWTCESCDGGMAKFKAI